jgi:hypothetical protein
MIDQTVKGQTPTSRPPGSSGRRGIALGTLCLFLYVELSVATRALLQIIGVRSAFLASLAIPFVLVFLLYPTLDRWFGPEPSGPAGGDIVPPRTPAGSKIWSAVPPEANPADPGAE